MQAPKISQEFFVEAGQDVQKKDSDFVTLARLAPEQLIERWKTPKGYSMLNTLKTNKFDRKILEGHVGRFYGQIDLRGIPLPKEDLTSVDLSGVDLFRANLEGSCLLYADLTDSFLSEANLKGACFDWAKMQNVLTDNADFDGRTSFVGVRLSSIDFSLAGQLKDHAHSQQRIQDLKSKYPQVATVLWATCDYGRSFPRFFSWCGGVILVFALAYWLFPGSLNKNGFWNSLFFSVMTFATSGCDIQAISATGKLLVSIETAIGFLMTGLLVSILVKRTIGD